MKYDWIRNKTCHIDGIEHTISHRMKRDRLNREKFTTLIIKNHITDPETICTFDSNSSAEMYQMTTDKLEELSKENYDIGNEID